MINVRSAALRGRVLETRDLTCAGVSLFPCFDSQGRVQAVILLMPDDEQIRFFDPQRHRLRVPLWGPIKIDASWTNLAGDPPTLTELWHFDPTWQLRDARFASHASTPPLKETNCAERLREGAREVYFDRRLTRLTWVFCRSDTKWTYEPLGREHLPPPRLALQVELAAESTVTSARVEWKLRPFWEPTSAHDVS